MYTLLLKKIEKTASFKGLKREMVFFAHCILSRIERKDLKICSCSIFSELGLDLTHLAHKENTQSVFLLWETRNFLIALN
jgi:hypothetical protein